MDDIDAVADLSDPAEPGPQHEARGPAENDQQAAADTRGDDRPPEIVRQRGRCTARLELVDDEGKPLKMQDEKHKQLKYDIIARDGYRAKQEVE